MPSNFSDTAPQTLPPPQSNLNDRVEVYRKQSDHYAIRTSDK